MLDVLKDFAARIDAAKKASLDAMRGVKPEDCHRVVGDMWKPGLLVDFRNNRPVFHAGKVYLPIYTHITGPEWEPENFVEAIYPDPVWERQELLGEFALILAAKGHAVDYQTLERLADVAVGDV
jgi:hypothetical protein